MSYDDDLYERLGRVRERQLTEMQDQHGDARRVIQRQEKLIRRQHEQLERLTKERDDAMARLDTLERSVAKIEQRIHKYVVGTVEGMRRDVERAIERSFKDLEGDGWILARKPADPPPPDPHGDDWSRVRQASLARCYQKNLSPETRQRLIEQAVKLGALVDDVDIRRVWDRVRQTPPE